MDRKQLKQLAKQTIRNSRPSILAAGSIYIVISTVFSYFEDSIYTKNTSSELIEKAYYYYENNMPENLFAVFEKMAPPSYTPLVWVAVGLVLSVLFAGFVIFLLNTIRKTEPCLGNLLDGFGFVFKIILLNILEGLFVMLWSLLLIVPGVIASYRYKMAIYILCDDPSKSVMQCIRESSRMMKGHKWEFFVLNLSFLLWYIGGCLPMVGYLVQLWSFPYIQTTKAHYYEQLRSCNIIV